MADFTVRIISFNRKGEMISVRSGFLYELEENQPPILITAGHHCHQKGSFVETEIRNSEGKPLCFNAGKFNVFNKSGEVDLAYSRIPVDIIRESLKSNVTISYKAYKYKFAVPSKKSIYGFAVKNFYEIAKFETQDLMSQYLCFEVEMKFHSENNWQYFFETQDNLKEDEYYLYGSGAPISDPEGRIRSILLGRTEDRKYLRGLKLSNFEEWIRKIK